MADFLDTQTFYPDAWAPDPDDVTIYALLSGRLRIFRLGQAHVTSSTSMTVTDCGSHRPNELSP